MRKMLFASAASLGLAVAMPALAQNAPAPANAPAAMPATDDQAGQSTMRGVQPSAIPSQGNPYSTRASNIDQADTRSTIAPALPAPPVGPGATPQEYLQAAQNALQRHRSGEAQEALERAETRLLDRSTAPTSADQPDERPAINDIHMALQAIGNRDWQGANQHIAAALQTARVAEEGTGGGAMMPAGAAGAPPPGGAMMANPGAPPPAPPGGNGMTGSPPPAPGYSAPASGNMGQ